MRVKLKKIICATDISDYSNHTIPYGIALAREFSAKLYVCHVIDLPTGVLYGETPIFFLEQQNRIVENVQNQIEALIGDAQIDWEPLVTIGFAADEISRMASEKGADLVIAATHGRSGLKRLILGSVTGRLMRTLPCPLLIVRGLENGLSAPADEGNWFQRILVGYDFSEDSSLAFQYALSLAQDFQSELHLVHVLEPPVYSDWLTTPIAPVETLQQDLRTLLTEKLAQKIPKEALNWCSLKTILLDGQPHAEITRYAVDNHIDLIVLGIRGYGLVESLLVGSTTDRVARRAPCPVLSVCPKK